MGKADPFGVLKMKISETTARTRVLADLLNPEWNKAFEFAVEDALHDVLILEYHHDTLRKDKIGRCIVTLTWVILEGEYQDCFPIEGSESGRLHFHLKWTPQLGFRDP